MKIRIYISLFILTTIAFTSCMDEISFPPEPSLELNGLGFIKRTALQDTIYDSLLVLDFKFTDGDGDLGVDTLVADTTNLYVDFFSLEKGEYIQKEDFPSAQIPFLPTSFGEEYLKGSMRYTLDYTLLEFEEELKLDSVKMNIYIEDRAYNKSNIVETPLILYKGKPN